MYSFLRMQYRFLRMEGKTPYGKKLIERYGSYYEILFDGMSTRYGTTQLYYKLRSKWEPHYVFLSFHDNENFNFLGFWHLPFKPE